MSAPVEVLVENAGELCEGPVWDARTGRLSFVDILAGTVHAVDPDSGAREQWRLGQPVGAIAPRAGGGWVAAVERGFQRYDGDWRPDGSLVPAPEQPDGTRFNDGACDPRGRFWAGTLAYDGTREVASLYRYDPDGTVTRMLGGVTNSNGIGWSPAGDWMYNVDTGTGAVDRLRFDGDSGTVSRRETLIAVPPADGLPDGLTVDAEGFLWLALWGGGAVRRYAPDGTLDRVVPVPAGQVTKPAFGGTGLSELYITSAWEGLSTVERQAQLLAGSVFRHRPGVAGRRPYAFAG